jgi:hypothetical protein
MRWTALAGIVVGYVRTGRCRRAEIELLMNAYAFDGVESEDAIRFLPRGRAAVALVGLDDSVLSEQGDLVKLPRDQENPLRGIYRSTQWAQSTNSVNKRGWLSTTHASVNARSR